MFALAHFFIGAFWLIIIWGPVKGQHRTGFTEVSMRKILDARIKMFKYEYRYCNPYKPKLFILTNETDPCTLQLNKLCPAGIDRLSDCSCAEKCKGEWGRNRMDDFLDLMTVYFNNLNNIGAILTRLSSRMTVQKPVEGLKATLTGKTVTLDWYIPVNSYDKFLLEEKGNVIETKVTRYSVTLSNAVPGEKYTWRVSTISNGVKSSTREAVVILPPLPPNEVHVDLVPGGYLYSDREIFWFKNDAMSKVDGYYISYNSTAAGISRRDIYVAVPYAQNKISYRLVDLKPGMQYDITVISQVDGVNSTYPTRRLISIPYDDDVKDILIITLISMIFTLIFMIGLLLYLLVKQYDLAKHALVSNNNNNNNKGLLLYLLVKQYDLTKHALVSNNNNNNNNNNKVPEKVHIVNKKYGNITKIRSKHVTANINNTDDNIPPESTTESSEDEI